MDVKQCDIHNHVNVCGHKDGSSCTSQATCFGHVLSSVDNALDVLADALNLSLLQSVYRRCLQLVHLPTTDSLCYMFYKKLKHMHPSPDTACLLLQYSIFYNISGVVCLFENNSQVT